MSSPAGQKKADFRSRKSALFFHTGSRVREHDTDGRARAGRALKLDAAVVILHGVLDDRQSEARAAGRLGVALIHAVEALEHTRLMLRRDADAGVGNVRELRNAVERSMIMADGNRLTADCLAPEFHAAAGSADPDSLALDDLERRHILRVLEHTRGNKAEAARLLGIGIATLYRKLDGYGVK